MVSQSFNGAVLQLGWEDSGITDASVRGMDVTGAEWYASPAHSTTGCGRLNDCVLNLRTPVYDLSLPQHHRNLSFGEIRVDTPVGCVVGLALLGSTKQPSSVHSVTLDNITVRRALQWLPTNGTAGAGQQPVAGTNFVATSGRDVVEGVRLRDVCVGGQRVTANHGGAGWQLLQAGNGTGPIQYRASSGVCQA